MSHSLAACKPQSIPGMRGCPMRSNYLLNVRRWAVLLNDAQRCGLPRRPSAAAEHNLSSSAATASDSAALPELIAWILNNNGRVDGATLANLAGRDGGSGWGLKASQDVDQGRRLVLLPPSCHLTYSAEDDPNLLSLIEKVPAELWGAKLALQLLAQRLRGPASSFAPYIANLPKGVPGLPMFFTRRALDLIDYPPVSQQVHKRCKWLFTFSQQELARLPGTEQDPFGGVAVDINALGWALGCVSSRAFRTRGPAQPAAMLPLVDMANHSFSPNVEVLPVEGGGVGLFAKRQISAGEPLLLSYGKLSNDFLFMDYGFIVPDNPYDTVQLRFDVGLLQAGALVSNVTDPEGAPLDLTLLPWRQAQLAALGLAGPAANTEINLGAGPDLIDPRLLAAARVMAAQREGEVAGRGAERLCALDRPLSRENELAALRIVAGVVAFALSNFKTTLDQDLALLEGRTAVAPTRGSADAPLLAAADSAAAQAILEPLASEDEVLAVRFRVEKKRILSRTLRRLAELTNAVAGAAPGGALRETTGVAAVKKGSKPTPATKKGFGKK